MNPKTPSQLDPKLKEVYDRVMGFNAPPTTQPATPAPSQTIAVNPQPAQKTTSFTATSVTSAKKTKISPVLLALVFVVFILVYAVFWFRFFNIQLPFLPL